jgi:hypothetical protein
MKGDKRFVAPWDEQNTFHYYDDYDDDVLPCKVSNELNLLI